MTGSAAGSRSWARCATWCGSAYCGVDWNGVFDNTTGLAWLCECGVPADMVEEAIDAGGDVNPGGSEERTPLYLALKYGREATARVLLRRGARPSASPVLYSLHDSLAHMTDELVGLGAEVDVVHCMLAPLYAAGFGGRYAVVMALLAAGADPLLLEMDPDDPASFLADVSTLRLPPAEVVAAVCAAAEGGEADRVARVVGHRTRWAWAKRRAAVVAVALEWL
jgi:hypothetical protein